MNKRTKLLAVAVAVLAPAAVTSMAAASPTHPASSSAKSPIYLNRSYSATERAADLVSRMTLAEKASQMNSSQSRSDPAAGHRRLRLVERGAHGVARERHPQQRQPSDR